MVPTKDISRYQGAWRDTGEQIVMVKIGGGDDGLYFDSEATDNYNGVIAAGKAFGGYWFAGGGNPTTEANYFMNGMQPLVPGEVPALDIESGKTWNPNAPGVDPVAWAMQFIDQVQARSGNPGGLIYMNLATLNAHDWTPVLQRWGLWLAEWDINPDGSTINTTRTVVMLQYSNGPEYDHDEWYGTVEQFKKYGWPDNAGPAPAPTTTTTEAPAPTPEPTTTTTTTELPPEPDPVTTTTTTEEPQPLPPSTTTTTTTKASGVPASNRWAIIVFLIWIFNKLQGRA